MIRKKGITGPFNWVGTKCSYQGTNDSCPRKNGSYQGTTSVVPNSICSAGALAPASFDGTRHLARKISSRLVASIIAVVFSLTLISNSASATTFTGTVTNGTTGKPAANVDVVLLSLQNDMQTVANSKTDSQGRFQLAYGQPSGLMPLLVRAIYKGMFFHGILSPGTTTADVQIYEPSANISSVQMPTHLIVCRPNGTTLLIDEIYSVQNQSSPPVAFFSTNGNFEFQTPDNADKLVVGAESPEHMNTTQGLIDHGKNHYAIAYAFRPGDSAAHLTYELPYAGNKAAIHFGITYTADKTIILAPPSVSISSAGFQPAGSEQGMSVYTRDGIPAGSTIDVSVSGTAPPPNDAGQQGQADPSAQGRDAGAPPVAAVAPRTAPYQWILLAGFGSIFLLGAAFLFRKPAPAIAPAAVAPQAPAPSASAFQGAAISTGQTFSGAAATQSLGEVNREVGASLDQLKDTLFRLELRHQAGTISEQEYLEQRARAEKTIRDLVKG
jgi:hypothetical protein